MALAHIAAGTIHIRIGAGGIMLPNHAPLLIAEQFGTLAALHPGRVDLRLGRALGSDYITARARGSTPAQRIDDKMTALKDLRLTLSAENWAQGDQYADAYPDDAGSPRTR